MTAHTDNLTQAEAEQTAWEWFAHVHPVEAHATWPDRFWQYFHSRAPNLSREQMVALLKEQEQ